VTDLLDAPEARSPDAGGPAEPDAAPAATRDEAGTAGPAARGPAVAVPTRWLLAALLAGAGAIHLAMAPSHIGESAVEGAGFLVAGWVQLALAAAVLLRPTRRVLLSAAVTSVALVVAWAVSRTAGLPFGAHSGHAETVSIVDGVTVALEVATLLVALSLVTRVGAGMVQRRGLALAGALLAVGFATAAVASPSARDHAAGSHGAHGDHADAGAGAHGEGAHGMGHGHDVTGTAQDPGFLALSNGHQHETGPDEPLTAEETVTLSRQLAATADLVEKYPTIADAEAAGWTRAGPFAPGLGVHYSSPTYGGPNTDGDMDPEDLASPMLVYDGLGADAKLAGFMYLAYGRDTVPEGFAGPNDHWHHHESVCIVAQPDGSIDTPFGADLEGVTEEMCTDVGGSFIAFTGYMVHVWNVPGYESPEGMFTELNPRITCPDGTYDRIPVKELGNKDSVCKNP
jgi:hypothetical protein